MTQQDELFGVAAKCQSIEEIITVFQKSHDSRVCLQAAAFGMVMAASSSVGEEVYFKDVLQVLNALAEAKATIDIVAWHSLDIAQMTGGILLAAQQFVDEETVPCTEWPKPREVADHVLTIATSLLQASQDL